MSVKVPGDGKLRAAIEKGLSDAGQMVAAFKDALEAKEGVVEAFFAFKKFFRASVYDLMGYKAKNNSTIKMSAEAIGILDGLIGTLYGADVSDYPRIAKELDPSEIGLTRSMLEACRERMVDANRIQTAKGRREVTE